MGKYATLAIGLCIVALLSIPSHATSTQEKLFSYGGYQFSQEFVEDKEIKSDIVKKNRQIVRSVLKNLPFMKDIRIRVHISNCSIRNVNAFTYYDNRRNYHVIVMARDTNNFTEVSSTFLHELGHVFQKARNINLQSYNRLVHRSSEDRSEEGWSYSLEEEFAEDFKIAVANKYYAGMDVEKRTYRPYTDRFRQTYRKLISNK